MRRKRDGQPLCRNHRNHCNQKTMHTPSPGCANSLRRRRYFIAQHSRGGIPQKVVTTVTAVTGISRSPRLSSSGGCGEALCKASEHDS
jgi:hypothetical protein